MACGTWCMTVEREGRVIDTQIQTTNDWPKNSPPPAGQLRFRTEHNPTWTAHRKTYDQAPADQEPDGPVAQSVIDAAKNEAEREYDEAPQHAGQACPDECPCDGPIVGSQTETKITDWTEFITWVNAARRQNVRVRFKVSVTTIVKAGFCTEDSGEDESEEWESSYPPQ